MNVTAVRIRIWLIIVLLFSAGVVWMLPYQTQEVSNGYLKVTFLDVGQGDAILITTPEGREVLIDGGRDSTVLTQLRAQQGWWDKVIEVVIATHFDGDHIGGLDEVLQKYRVAQVLIAGNTTQSPEAALFEDAIAAEGVTPVVVRAGDILTVGASTTLEIFSPTYDVSDIESNNSSIVARLQYGETAFLFTGDAPREIEEYLVAKYGDTLTADVVKLGHHGSRTSSSPLFLETVDALYGIVSAAAENGYGHPHEEVVAAVDEAGMVMLETSREGAITFLSDGERVWRE